MNKVILMGRLTRDPEVHYLQSKESMAIARYTLAVRKRKAKESDNEAEFIDVVAFYKDAEFAEKYLKKGVMIAVTGSLHKGSWEDSEHVKHSKMEVVVDGQYFTSSKKEADAFRESVSQSSTSEIASSQIEHMSFNEEDLTY